jgi:hypothetical protein
MTLPATALECLGGHDDGFDRQVGAAQDFTNPINGPAGQVPDDQQVDVAPLVLLSSGERPEDVDGGNVELAPKPYGQVR